MDISEENQLHIYELEEEKKRLKDEIDKEQYSNSCLHKKRSMFSASIIRNIIIFLYFLFLFVGIRFLTVINEVWNSAKENPVIQKLLELSDIAFFLIQAGLLLAMAVTLAFLIRKLFLIWLNSDNLSANHMAERMQRSTYSKQIAISNQKLAAYYFRLQEIEEELQQCTNINDTYG